jgi:hydroxymethylpyrimidine/phosphomethylpyrimidine kinase
MEQLWRALTIAGSDSGGGAGIQADLKTFQEFGVYGMSAITAVTAQNTLGVHGVYPLDAHAIVAQIKAVLDDIGADAVKTGMLFSAEIIEAVAETLQAYRVDNIVVDPVMVAKGGARLLEESAIGALRARLIPLATIVTPNIPEAEVLTDMSIRTLDDRKRACEKIAKMGARAVIVKGGHDTGEEAVDVLYADGEWSFLKARRIDTRHTHGTGCTFSAAICAQLAKGKAIADAVRSAKQFISLAIEHAKGIGQGHGPTNHWAYRLMQ